MKICMLIGVSEMPLKFTIFIRVVNDYADTHLKGGRDMNFLLNKVRES